MSTNFKAVIFDLDGTLLDTLEDITDSMNTVLVSYGYPVHSTERYKYFIGDGVYSLAKKALPNDQKLESIISECAEKMLQEYGKRWANKTKLYDGIPTLLDGLTRKKIQLAILSNKPDHLTQEAVHNFLQKWRFDIIAGAHPDIPKKPCPDGALAIAKQLKTSAEKILYVGDTDTDMATAIAAKMYPAAALWGFRTKDELIKAGAKVFFDHPTKILELF